MRLPGILDPKTWAERAHLKLIAKEQAQNRRAEAHRRFLRKVKIFGFVTLASLAGLAGLLIYLADTSIMDVPTVHPIGTATPELIPQGCSSPTTECRDGSTTCATGRGACSHHGGIAGGHRPPHRPR